VNVSQLITVDKRLLTGLAGRVTAETMREVEAGIKIVLSL
jgi:mRNA-degrading endonuclease toxin of MazEF toxin-antitoxin module